MKKNYIADVNVKDNIGEHIVLFGWIKAKRDLGHLIFIELVDSTDTINVVANKSRLSIQDWEVVSRSNPEAAVEIAGTVNVNNANGKEISLTKMLVLGDVKKSLGLPPRRDFDFTDPAYVNTILDKRHLYLKNPTMVRILRMKHYLRKAFCDVLDENGFMHVDMPILTQVNLYGADAAFEIDYFGVPAYLSQCAGLYLNATAQALERIYTIAPSFRFQKSKSPRHNPEFWHIKGQKAFCDLDSMIEFTSELIYETYCRFADYAKVDLEALGITRDSNTLKPPYPRISYPECVSLVCKHNIEFEWGKSFGQREEKIISDQFDKPVFIMNLPSRSEPYPYKRSLENAELTVTADLLATEGYGELLGIAEFVESLEDLSTAITSQPEDIDISKLEWYCELREQGFAPISGFGLGLERVLRWLLRLPHIRDTFPFPRLYGRQPYP